AILPMEFMLSSLRIMGTRGLDNEKDLEKWIEKIIQLDEQRSITHWSRKQEKARQKAWHDRNIRDKKFEIGQM
ncbi:hypothetical protein KI387_008046, partial [Taxus chinensis]